MKTQAKPTKGKNKRGRGAQRPTTDWCAERLVQSITEQFFRSTLATRHRAAFHTDKATARVAGHVRKTSLHHRQIRHRQIDISAKHYSAECRRLLPARPTRRSGRSHRRHYRLHLFRSHRTTAWLQCVRKCPGAFPPVSGGANRRLLQG